MMTVAEYRQAVLQAILQAKDKDGAPRTDEETAKTYLDSLSDNELEEGMLFKHARGSGRDGAGDSVAACGVGKQQDTFCYSSFASKLHTP